MSGFSCSCQLRFLIYIYIHARVSCVPFFPYTQETPLKINIVYSRYPENLMFEAVCVLVHGHNRIENKTKADLFGIGGASERRTLTP